MSQLESWMSSELFEKWAHEHDQKFVSDKQKIALISDNWKDHLHFDHLEWIELRPIPPLLRNPQNKK